MSGVEEPSSREVEKGIGAEADRDVEAFLRGQFGPGVSSVVTIGAGEWSRAFSYELDGEVFVIRFGSLDEDFRKDALAARWATAALPIPEILAIGEGLGGYYAISRRAEGRFLDDLDEGAVRATLPALLATFDVMRSAHLNETNGFGPWGVSGEARYASWREALLAVGDDRPGTRTHGWRDRLAASQMGSRPFAEAWTRLEHLTRGEPVGRSLIHGDLLNRNVLTQDGRISAVLDWGCAMYGDFLYDVAWLRFWQPWYPAWQRIDFVQQTRSHFAAQRLEIPRFTERLLACQLQIGLDSQAYCAFRERWEMLDEVAMYTLGLVRGEQ